MLSVDQVVRACEGEVHDDVSSQASKHVVQTEDFARTNVFFTEATRYFIDEALKHRPMALHSLQGKERGQCGPAWLMNSIIGGRKCCPRYIETILEKPQLAIWCRWSIDGFEVVWVINMNLEWVNADDWA